MDQKTAASLLEEIRNEKQAFWGSGPTRAEKLQQHKTLDEQLHASRNASLQKDSINNIIKAMLYAGGAGMGLRGLTGLKNLMTPDATPVSSRTVDMPVAYPMTAEEEEEKQAKNEDATTPWGLNYYIPGMVLGAPLAAYAGWKGIDSILDKQRHGKTQDELDQAKADYEQALLGAYKTASAGESTETLLDSVFDGITKQATEKGWVDSFITEHFPNAGGMAKGLAATYAIPATIGGYAIVDSMMKKHSKRRLLQKAMEERARRQARNQPAELYAIPVPREEKPEERI